MLAQRHYPELIDVAVPHWRENIWCMHHGTHIISYEIMNVTLTNFFFKFWCGVAGQVTSGLCSCMRHCVLVCGVWEASGRHDKPDPFLPGAAVACFIPLHIMQRRRPLPVYCSCSPSIQSYPHTPALPQPLCSFQLSLPGFSLHARP